MKSVDNPAARISTTAARAIPTTIMPPIGIARSPLARVRHRGPRFGRGFGVALLQKLDGNAVGRAHEGHVSVTRRPVDGDAALHQLLADGVTVVHMIGEMAEVAPADVF